MRRCLLLVALCASGIGPADARIDVRTLTCAQARALVQSEGAIVLTTGRYTYDRFVSDHRFCDRDEVTRPRRTPTRDDEACRIGCVCQPRPDFLFPRF
jgi:hypothetical protein